MKYLIIVLLTVCPLVVAAQETIVEKTTLSEVKIYQNGAYVTRTANARLKAGINKVVFTGLSPYVNAQSVSVKGTGDGMINNVSFKIDYLKDKIKPAEIIRLENLLDSLTYRHQQILNASAVLKEEESLILANKSIGGANNGVLADELELMLELFSKKLASIKESMLQNSIKEKKIKEQLEKVKNELAQRNAGTRQTGDIVAEVNVKSATAATFELNYLIHSGVSWYGFYDVRVKDINSNIDIIYKAKVTQQTGEDWNEAKIRLSTGNPRAGTVKPELMPWYLRFHVPVPVPYRSSAAESQQKIQAAPAGADAMAYQMQPMPVRVAETQLSNEYIINIPYTIKSDGEEYQVEIQSYSLPAVYEYISAPKLDADAFLTAKITGWENLTVSPGSANIYFDGAYVGESYVNPVADDTLTVSLGRDKRISIKREKVKDFSGTKLFGNNRERSFAYDITVKNNKSMPVEIVIEDQLPLSSDKEIEVKAAELSSGVLHEESGRVSWKLKLGPNESKKIRFAFTVVHPKNKPLTGL